MIVIVCFFFCQVLQALGINFTCISASEPVDDYRKYQRANCHRLVHQHEDMDSQLAGLPCKMHPSNLLCEVDMFPDSFVVGAPCNPFSRQSHKRFRENSVMDHQFTDLTLKRVLDCMQEWHPVTATMETTDGFLLPLHSGAKTTPYMLLLTRTSD